MAWIEEGEDVQITKRRRVVAKLVPMKTKVVKVKWPDLAARRSRIYPESVKGKPASAIVDEARGDY